MSEPIVTDMDEKGRVTVPEALIKKIGLEAPATVVAWCEGDAIAMTVLKSTSPQAAWRELCQEMDEKNITMSEDEVVELIHRHRKEQRQERMQASPNASKMQS